MDHNTVLVGVIVSLGLLMAVMTVLRVFFKDANEFLKDLEAFLTSLGAFLRFLRNWRSLL